jgi:hypothetical protein
MCTTSSNLRKAIKNSFQRVIFGVEAIDMAEIASRVNFIVAFK